tara:strand:- start:337 stop:885 length:549 start_codon:yes stop_codon:yes gene_type:complete
MVELVTQTDFLEKEIYLDRVRNGDVFIYPTDTIYGIGCNALIEGSVEKIRKIKKRDTNPFSVIAPSKDWIIENCSVENLDKLPGKYTLILKIKRDCVVKGVNPELDTLGVRIPDHWISKFANRLGLPIITTSVNQAGEKYMTSLNDLDKEIKNEVDFMVDTGVLNEGPSQIIDTTKKTVIER